MYDDYFKGCRSKEEAAQKYADYRKQRTFGFWDKADFDEVQRQFEALPDTHKTPGQILYEKDCMDRPFYCDGTKRREWETLNSDIKRSWEHAAKRGK